jgi:hypothetical protein
MTRHIDIFEFLACMFYLLVIGGRRLINRPTEVVKIDGLTIDFSRQKSEGMPHQR